MDRRRGSLLTVDSSPLSGYDSATDSNNSPLSAEHLGMFRLWRRIQHVRNSTNVFSRDDKIVFSWKLIIVCWKSIIFWIIVSLVASLEGGGEGADHPRQVTLSRSDGAVEVGGGEAGLQRRRQNRPAPHAASNSHLLSRLVNSTMI